VTGLHRQGEREQLAIASQPKAKKLIDHIDQLATNRSCRKYFHLGYKKSMHALFLPSEEAKARTGLP
jgi:hypothetical protein